MAQVLSLAALIVLLFTGWLLLALSQPRHWRALCGTAPRVRAMILGQRFLGGSLLAISLPLALWRDGSGFGSLLWGTLLSFAAYTVTWLLSRRPGWLRSLAQLLSTTGH
ncbi:MAG: DUF3325 domain-containing protein [Nitrospira sp.]